MFKWKWAPSLKGAKVSGSLAALPAACCESGHAVTSSICLPMPVSARGRHEPPQLHAGVTWKL